mgnify:FL=1
MIGLLIAGTSCQAQEQKQEQAQIQEENCGDELMLAKDGSSVSTVKSASGESMSFAIDKNNDEWKNELSPEEFRVLREKGTEVAYTGKYYKFDKDGVYRCAGCGHTLFTSTEKYHSGSGWPSFYAPAEEETVVTQRDESHGMVRVEVMCANCGGHLGHVFEDGPRPTGLRYCINSVSLEFKEESDNEE